MEHTPKNILLRVVKKGKKDEKALEQIRKLGMSESAEHGTTLVNAATALRAAGQYEAALEAYREAEQIYSICLPSEDARFAGLYNNMSLAYERQNAHEEALSCLQKALSVILQTADAKEESAAYFAPIKLAMTLISPTS